MTEKTVDRIILIILQTGENLIGRIIEETVESYILTGVYRMVVGNAFPIHQTTDEIVGNTDIIGTISKSNIFAVVENEKVSQLHFDLLQVHRAAKSGIVPGGPNQGFRRKN